MSTSLLSDSTVAFIEREVAIDISSCSASLRPSACRAFACRVAPDRQRLTLFVRRREATQLLQDVLVRDVVAAVFCLPATEVAIQIKGCQVSLSAATADEVRHIQAYCDGFVDAIVQLGYDREFGQSYMAIDPDQMVALSFTPEVVFEQTPGPLAGQCIGGRAP